MGLYRVPNSPFWYYTVTVNGKRYRKSTKRTIKAEAERVRAEFLRRTYDADQLGLLPEITLAEAIDRALAASRNNRDQEGLVGRAAKLLGKTQQKGRWHIPGTTPLHCVTSATVAALRAARAAEGNAPATINREVALLQRIYNLARVQWGVRVAPNVNFPKHKETSKLRALTPEEVSRLLAELDPHRLGEVRPRLQQQLQDQYDLTVFLLDTGARYSEVARITWDAIDTRDWKIINLYHWKVGKEGQLAMTARLREVLQRRHRVSNQPYVFPGYGDAIGPRGYATGGIRKAIERAGLNAPHLVERYGKATVHTFRDTFATTLVKAGVSLYKVQVLLGHSTPTMTQKYAKLAPSDAAAEAARVLDETCQLGYYLGERTAHAN